jgi:2-oxoisovalerate dehydrogenase E2 component (dihydrolipoyl transacylase)
MGAYVIRMPDIGEGIAEVEIAAWRVKPGDAIAEDDVVADVMTDKATVEIPSPVSGVVLALGGEAGLLMAVGAELLRLEVDGPGNLREGAAAPAVPVVTAPVPAVPVTVDRTPVEPVPVAPARPVVADVAARLPLSVSDKPLASPAVRQYALDRGVNLRFVQGSGPAGRILRDDVWMPASRVCGPRALVHLAARCARTRMCP